MDGKCSGLTETLSTLLAFKWLLFGMDVPVVSQVVLPPEGLVTDVTSIGPLICVRALVDQQVIRFGEVTATELAHKLLFRLGWESSSAGLPFWRGELGHIQQAA